jgi:5-methylcytosine-specific restriction endonuclease McrA
MAHNGKIKLRRKCAAKRKKGMGLRTFIPKVKPLKYRKCRIPAALREQVWLHQNGPCFSSKCAVKWCKNRITVFDFQCGHKHAEAEGGNTTLDNLIPLCSRCNQSMGVMHFDEWQKLGGGKLDLK